MKIKVGISNRHVHLNKETYALLFDEDMSKVSDLHQIGEFVSNQKVILKNGDVEIANVKVLGPLRDYNQVEISKKDALKLKINPPVRRSGDLDDAVLITLKTEKGEVTIKACILAQRHVHMNDDEAEKLGFKDKEKVKLVVNNDRSGIMDAYIKVSANGYFEAHLDTDDASSFLLNQDDEVELLK